jgi:sialate O-acetylesterase
MDGAFGGTPENRIMLRVLVILVFCAFAAVSQTLRVTGGIADDQVLQRGPAGTADAQLRGISTGAAGKTVEARLLRKWLPLEGFDWTVLARIEGGSWSGVLRSIPAGGPYRLELRIAGTDSGAAVQNLLVGDLWVLAGQSNMDGHGVLADLEQPNPLVHSFDMADHWLIAEEPLHLLPGAADRVHWGKNANHQPERLEGQALRTYIANRRTGAGLGLPFAVEMVRRTGVPVGLIPCAHGGTSMAEWDPALRDRGGDSLYGAMLRRVRATGGKVKGVLWYQGESETNPHAAGLYLESFKRLVSSIREDFEQPDLPFYYVQISRYTNNDNVASWNTIQELQRRAESEIPHCAMTAAIDLPLDDGIHISNHGLKQLGLRLAHVALGFPRGPRPLSATLLPNNAIRVVFADVNGKLEAPERVAGFSIHGSGGERVPLIFDARFDPEDGRAVLLYLDKNLPPGAVLRYGYGKDPYCNLRDSAGMAAPVFGPMEVRR